MRKLFVLVFVLFALGADSLYAQVVINNQHASSDFDKSVDFSKFKTYKWVKIPSTEQLDELTAEQLVGTLQVELAKKGLKNTPSDNADLYIGYQITNAKQSPNFNIGGSYGSVGGGSMNTAATTTVHSGELLLNMYDPASKRLVWQGAVSNAIDADAKPEKKQNRMSEAIEKLLKKYPPQKK